jgi:hypothetical protein
VGRAPIPYLLALLCGFAASVAVATGCGGDRSNLIPSQRADQLISQLDAIKARIDAGECDGLAQKVDAFHDDATSLTKPVDSRLRKRINDGVRSLQAHAVDNCEAVAQAATETQPTTTETTPTTTATTPTTTETTPTTTETTPTTTATTPTTPTDTGTQTTPVPPTDTGTTPPAGAGDGGDGSDNGGTPGEELTP